MQRNFLKYVIAIMLLLCVGCNSKQAASDAENTAPKMNATWDDPPLGLEFLRTVPELRGITLEINEQDFLKLIQSQKLEVKPDHSRAGETSYFITTPSGENVVVMFADGNCKGIQRLQPTPVKQS
jgi:hypothetical protein